MNLVAVSCLQSTIKLIATCIKSIIWPSILIIELNGTKKSLKRTYLLVKSNRFDYQAIENGREIVLCCIPIKMQTFFLS